MKITPQALRLKNNVVLNIIIAAVVLELISASQFYYSHQLLADELELRAESEITMKGIVVKSALNLSENSLMGHLWDMERSIETPDSLYNVMEVVLKTHPNLVGCWIAFVPNYYPEKGKLFEPYVFWDQDTIRRMVIGSEDYEYSKSIYFKKVVSTNASMWIDPYLDVFTGTRMVSYAVPIRDDTKHVVAVFGLDVSTKMLGDTLNHKQIYPSSYELLLTKEGQLVAAPDTGHVKSRDVDNIIRIINDSTVAKRKSKNGKCRIATFYNTDNHDKGYVYYTSFKDKPDWQIAVVCYDDEIFGALRNMYLTILLTTLAGIIVLGFIVGHFIKNNRKLLETKKQKSLIDSELRIANNIQMQMLPKQMLSDERDDIGIFGSVLPAREVGGDLFDYFIRDEKLFFCIGDVSGKGVPAAMLMAVAHSWFRAISTHQKNPAHIMQTLNETSCEGNESNMFITLFIGILDLPTGHLCYCNAGHDAPIILREKGKVNSEKFLSGESVARNAAAEEATALPVNPNLPIGVFKDFNYEMQETTIENGSTLFLYTDGLTEAMNKDRQQFGINRVLALLDACQASDPRQLLEMMTHEVQVFANGIEQSDDLTMLAIHYTPRLFESTLTETLVLRNDVHEVARFSQFMKSIADRLDIEASLARRLRLAVEEAVVNVIDYAYPAGTTGDVTIRMMSDDKTLRCQIVDTGIPFDPTAKEKTDTSLSAEERQIGGLGILLVRELMDTINYERKNGKNVLTLVKKLKL